MNIKEINKICYCASNLKFSECCLPIILGQKNASTAEELMRSRYSAYVIKNFDYLKESLDPEKYSSFNKIALIQSSKNIKWLKLEILETFAGKENDELGEVIFIAYFKLLSTNKKYKHHEHSYFKKINGKWFFVYGDVK